MSKQPICFNGVVKVLKPFEEVTEAVGSKGSSAALVISVVNSLIYFLDNTSANKDEGVQAMKKDVIILEQPLCHNGNYQALCNTNTAIRPSV